VVTKVTRVSVVAMFTFATWSPWLLTLPSLPSLPKIQIAYCKSFYHLHQGYKCQCAWGLPYLGRNAASICNQIPTFRCNMCTARQTDGNWMNTAVCCLQAVQFSFPLHSLLCQSNRTWSQQNVHCAALPYSNQTVNNTVQLYRVPPTLGWPNAEGTWLICDYFIWCVSCTVAVWTGFVMCGSVCVGL
jgi:hypothetical protein